MRSKCPVGLAAQLPHTSIHQQGRTPRPARTLGEEALVGPCICRHQCPPQHRQRINSGWLCNPFCERLVGSRPQQAQPRSIPAEARGKVLQNADEGAELHIHQVHQRTSLPKLGLGLASVAPPRQKPPCQEAWRFGNDACDNEDCWGLQVRDKIFAWLHAPARQPLVAEGIRVRAIKAPRLFLFPEQQWPEALQH